MHNRRTRLSLTLLTMLAPAAAMAHPGHGAAQDFLAGLAHPLSGLDHLLMIMAVSAWAALLPAAGRVAVAACLALFVALGAALPVAPQPGVALEAAIALTVVGAGILLAMGRRWPLWATAATAATFALIHGFAHGAEGPSESLLYVPGLVVATALLALAVSFGVARVQAQRAWVRAGGWLSAATGALLLA